MSPSAIVGLGQQVGPIGAAGAKGPTGDLGLTGREIGYKQLLRVVADGSSRLVDLAVPGGYNNLEVRWQARSTWVSWGVESMYLAFNGDAVAANYWYLQTLYGSGAGVGKAVAYSTVDGIGPIGSLPTSYATAGMASSGVLFINNCGRGDLEKGVHGTAQHHAMSNSYTVLIDRFAIGGGWRGRYPIERLTFALAAGGGNHLAAGSTFTLYGIGS